ncbi:B3/4 domain-containing protein [Acidobacteriota bacterium]
MPKDLYYTVSDEIFKLFPGYTRGVVLAQCVVNSESPPDLVSMLRETEKSVRDRLLPEKLSEHPRIASWREAFRTFGAKPGKYRSSVEAMVRRVLQGQDLPSINTLVDIGNIISLRHLVPAGGHATDVLTKDIELRPATGEEEFTPFGSEQMEHPVPGEIVLVEGNEVLTRRWTWRQANHTLTLPETSALELNIDGLPPVPEAEIEAACLESIELITLYCRGRTSHQILTQANPRIRLNE